MIRLIKILIYVIIIKNSLFTQPTLEWARTYNGPLNQTDLALATFVDDSGYVYVTGVIGLSSTTGDYCTIKYKPNGDSLWVRIYGQSGNTYEVARDIITDSIGNVYVTGDHYTIKYNNNGNFLWLSSNNSSGIKIINDYSNNILVLGKLQNYYYTITKYNPNNGDSLYRKYISARNNSYDMVIDKQNNIYIAGIANGPFPPNYQDFLVVKVSSSGDSLWSWRYNGPDPQQPFDAAYAICIDDSGYVYATGGSDDINGTGNWFTVKLTPNGDSVWTRRFNIGGSYAYDIDADRFGNIYVSGITNITQATVVKYSNSGTFQWSRTLPHTMILGYRPYQTLDTTGSVYITATSDNFNGLQLVKYSPSGVQLWFINYNYTEPRDIMVKNTYLYITGGFYGVNMITLKYSQPIGIQPISNEIPNSFKLYQNYPNPFNSSTNIVFDIPTKDFISLKIYDVLGREVADLISEELNPDKYEYEWSILSLPSGIYFYKLTSNNYSETKKLILIK